MRSRRRFRGSALLELTLLLPVLVPALVAVLALGDLALEPLRQRELARLLALSAASQPWPRAGAAGATAAELRSSSRRRALDLAVRRARGWPREASSAERPSGSGEPVAGGGVRLELLEGVPLRHVDATRSLSGWPAARAAARVLGAFGVEPVGYGERWARRLVGAPEAVLVARAQPEGRGPVESFAVLPGTWRVTLGGSALPVPGGGSTNGEWADGVAAAGRGSLEALPGGVVLSWALARRVRPPRAATAFFGLPPLEPRSQLVSRPHVERREAQLALHGAPRPGQVDPFALTGARAERSAVTCFETLPLFDDPSARSATALLEALGRRGPWFAGCPRSATEGCPR